MHQYVQPLTVNTFSTSPTNRTSSHRRSQSPQFLLATMVASEISLAARSGQSTFPSAGLLDPVMHQGGLRYSHKRPYCEIEAVDLMGHVVVLSGGTTRRNLVECGSERLGGRAVCGRSLGGALGRRMLSEPTHTWTYSPVGCAFLRT